MYVDTYTFVWDRVIINRPIFICENTQIFTFFLDWQQPEHMTWCSLLQLYSTVYNLKGSGLLREWSHSFQLWDVRKFHKTFLLSHWELAGLGRVGVRRTIHYTMLEKTQLVAPNIPTGGKMANQTINSRVSAVLWSYHVVGQMATPQSTQALIPGTWEYVMLHA